MNIRIPSSFESVPDAAQGIPDRVRRGNAAASSRLRLILGILGAVLLAALVIFVVLPLLGGAKPRATPAPPVVVQRAAKKDLSVVEHTIGTVVSPATVQLTARVQGQLLKAYFVEGQTVHRGDLLFQIDPGPFRAALDNAEATLGTAQQKAARYGRLLTQKAVAPQDADDAEAAYLVAKANVDAARLNLGYTQIRSPIDGKTGAIMIQPGNQITPSGSGMTSVGVTNPAASTLVVITQMRPIKISFALPQADLPRIQKRLATQGMVATLTPQGGGTPLTATVDFVGNQVSDQTGTIELRATFANENEALVPGQLVDVGVVLDTIKGATTVPHDAVNLGPNTSFVYVVKNGVAQMVTVKVISDDGTSAAIQGLVKAGDAVITDGQLKVVAGKPVKVSRAPTQQK
ncbi:MAG: efflux RND transporter periplasmic adaptor subunit [Rhizomicrobium sp.]